GRHPTGGPHDLEPVIFVAFNQRIDRDAMAEHVGLRIGGSKVGARLATSADIERDDEARRLVERAEEGRFIALVPQQPLPRDTEVTVVVARGAPSAEGPKVTSADQSFTFRTYPPLKLVRHQCGWRDECPPDMDWRIEFNNPLDEELFDPDAVQVEPAVSGLQVEQWGSNLRINGTKQGRTRYTVTVPAALTDRFGQSLERDERVTFDVGPAAQTLFGPGKTLVTLDPAGKPSLPVHTINHRKLKVRIHQVQPEHWIEFNEWMQRYRYDDAKPKPLPGRKVLDKRITIAGEPDRLVQTSIDLGPHLAKGRGQLLVWIEPDPQPADRWNRQELILWVQVTGIGVSAFVDGEELLAWTTRLHDGATLPGASVTLLPGKQAKGRADDAGLARLPLGDDSGQARLLVAEKDGDTAILPADSGWWHGGGWQRVARQEELCWFTFDDRGMYRPGEEVRVKGWVRRYDPGKGGDVNAPEVVDGRIEWSLRGPRGNDLLSGQARLSALAGFDIGLTLPAEVNLGTASLEIHADGVSGVAGTTHSHPIRIQEFRRPEFQVKAGADPGPWVLGQEASVTVSAAYYAGGGLAGAPVVWTAVATPSSYSPPGHEDFQFGVWSPWWRAFGGDGGGQSQRFEGVTDTLGDHHLGIHFEAMNPARPYNVRAEASVADVNRQSWSASQELLVHPAELYAGLRSDKGFYGPGDTVEVHAIAVDIDGAIRPGVKLGLEMVRLSSKWRRGKWTEEELDPETCQVESGADPVRCT
ncbi:MAG TPA: MG2 domain-containing protein, partial [Polyangia bacterium]|nr:MG2 domain-containing protein [Polyangia bacterium]